MDGLRRLAGSFNVEAWALIREVFLSADSTRRFGRSTGVRAVSSVTELLTLAALANVNIVKNRIRAHAQF